MSAFGRKLAAEFEAEFARLANGWFLKWHELARGEPVEVDDFRGGFFRPPSKTFDAAAEHTYWLAIRRYIANTTAETFARIEREIGTHTGERAWQIIDDGAIALRSFLEKLHRHAVFTEHRLQARGYPEERHLSRRDAAILADVQQRKAALLKKYGAMSWAERIGQVLSGTWMRLVALAILSASLAGGAMVVFCYVSPAP